MKLTRQEILRRIRLGNLRSLFRARWGAILPDDDAGRGDLLEMLICISLGENASLKMAHAIEVWAPWMPRAEGAELIDHVSRMPSQDRKLSPGTLGQRLRVTNRERERLGLWTIAPFDMTPEQMADQRKAKKAARDAKRYTRSRAQYLEEALSKTKPWRKEGISRRTWERKRDASQRQQLEGHGFTDFPPTHDVSTLPEPLQSYLFTCLPLRDSQQTPNVDATPRQVLKY
jgi:hypothetical protein